MTNTIEIENAGPIAGSFAIQLNGPGLYELRGSKGTGKSTVLNCLELLAGHRVDISIHDDELSGQVSGFGRAVPLKSRRGKGELEVHTFESEKFSIADLIDPPFKSESARDKHRLKAMLALTGTQLSREAFAKLLGAEVFEQLDVEHTEDPVELARRVKVALESQARHRESQAEYSRGKAAAARQSIEGVDTSRPHDAKALDTTYEQAVRDLAALEEQQTAAITAKQTAQTTKCRLEEIIAGYKGPSIDEASQDVKMFEGEKQEAETLVKQLEQQLSDAKGRLQHANDALKTSQRIHEQAVEHQRVVSELTAQLNQDVVDVDAQAIERARQFKDNAQADRDRGVKIREALAAAEQIKELDAEARKQERLANWLRDKARSTDEVLAEAFASDNLTVKMVDNDLRVVFRKHSGRGKPVLFEQLSDGEKTVAVLDLLLPALEPPALLPIPQRTYQDLPPADRQRLEQYAREHNLYLFGGLVDDGKLSVHRYVTETATATTR